MSTGEHDKLGLGRLVKVDPKSVWKHEAYDLTPWVLENLDLLGEQLGIEIQASEREVSVGSFSLDVLGEDATGRLVIVENQLEPTNHGHLGQLLVYASGLEAAVPRAKVKEALGGARLRYLRQAGIIKLTDEEYQVIARLMREADVDPSQGKREG